jgi:hypothetical protein
MQPRLIGLKALQSYVGLGEKNAAQLGREAGAVVRYGARILYDITEIDRYIDQMKEASANGRTDYSI